MDELLTDQQQAENVKSWIRQNGAFLLAGVVLGLGALFGWNQWNHFKERQAEAASVVYDTFLQAVRANQLEQAEAGMAELAADYGSSPYTDQGRLAMARLYLEQNKADKAAEYLQQVVSTAGSPEFRNIARLRLARLLIYQEKYPEALKTLNDPGSKAFEPAFHDVRGDVYTAMGKTTEARGEYEQALRGDVATNVIDRVYVQAKLDDLATLDDLGGASADLDATPTPAETVPAQAVPAP